MILRFSKKMLTFVAKEMAYGRKRMLKEVVS